MPETEAHQHRRLSVFRELLQAAVLALLIFLGTHSAIQAREVLGPSMLPTYHTGEHLIVNSLLYAHVSDHTLARFLPFVQDDAGTTYLFHAPRQGDVIVFRPPVPGQDDYIKRVIGVPGDHIAVHNGQVSVNGRRLNESYLHGLQTQCSGRWCDVRLGADQYYVLGDNRPMSSDSRYWGPARGDQIVGKAWLRTYPFSEFGPVP